MPSLLSRSKSSRLFGQSAHELVLLFDGLESSVTIFGRSIDELEVDGFEVGSLGGSNNGLSECDSSLAGTSDTALDHEPVLVDNTIVREATNWRDTLLSEISLSGSRFSVSLFADSENALVDFGTMVITQLTGTGNCELNSGRVPCSDTGNLSQPSVCLSWKTSDSPTADDTSISFTTSSSADINAFALSEPLGDVDFLLEECLGEINL